MKLEVFFDYACPYCYLGLEYLRKLQRPGLELVWRPCEAHPRPEPRPAVSPGDTVWWKSFAVTAEQEGLVLNSPHSPVSHSDRAIQGLLYVMEHGGDVWAYHDGVFRAMFADGQDIELDEVLAGCAASAGLAVDGFLQALDRGDYASQQRALNTCAWEENAFAAVPSYVMRGQKLGSREGTVLKSDDLADFIEKNM